MVWTITGGSASSNNEPWITVFDEKEAISIALLLRNADEEAGLESIYVIRNGDLIVHCYESPSNPQQGRYDDWD